MKKQKYRFSFTRTRSMRIKYNTGLLTNGEYYKTYQYNSTELITQDIVGNSLYFNLSDDFLNKIIKVATFINGSLLGINETYLVTENTRQFEINASTTYIISWQQEAVEISPSNFFNFEVNYIHPVFSKLSIDRTRSKDNMTWAVHLNSDLIFKGTAFNYIDSLDLNDGIIFKIERFDYSVNTYRSYYSSMPFTKAFCTLDYDRKECTVDFETASYNSYFEKRLNIAVNIAKNGYKHERMHLNIPAMMQVYVDGSDEVTNIVGGSAVTKEITYPETPDEFMNVPVNYKYWGENRRAYYLSYFGFCLVGRIAEIKLVGGNYFENNLLNSPAGYYYATTSDAQNSQNYLPSNNVVSFYNDTSDFYISLDTTSRYLYIKKKANNLTIYKSTLPLNTNCIMSQDNIDGTILQGMYTGGESDYCAIELKLTHNVYARILTTKEELEGPYNNTVSLAELAYDDFSYSGLAYKYFYKISGNYKTIYSVTNVSDYDRETFVSLYNGAMQDTWLFKPMSYANSLLKLVCSSVMESVDTGLGAHNPTDYYSYKNITGSNIQQHIIPIGKYFWSGVSFYIALPNNFISILEPHYNLVEQHCYFTIGTAIKELLHAVAPNIKFAETIEYSNILYRQQTSALFTVQTPNIYLTHASNIQAGLFNTEAQKVELTLEQILDMLRDAFQIYYYVDEQGKLHLEHITSFYAFNIDDATVAAYNTEILRDAYTKKLLDYGQGKLKANNSYLYSSIELTSDSDDATELFAPLEIQCLEESCLLLDKKEVSLDGFKTDIDFIYADMQERSDDIVLVLPIKDPATDEIILSFSNKNRCDIKGLNEYNYTLWPTNYKASSFELLRYYRWNFASLVVDSCAFYPIDRARYFEQEIQIPIDVDVDIQNLIHTRFGNGFIISYKLDLDSRYATLVLLHKG